MNFKYYYVKSEVDQEGVAHSPYATVEFLVEVPFTKLAASATAESGGPDEMAVAIGIAGDVLRTKYPVDNASYNMRRPTLELDPSAVIGRGDFITATNGSKGWLISQS